MMMDERIRYTVIPQRVVLTRGNAQNPEILLAERELQATMEGEGAASLTGKGAGILLDFGREMHGLVQLATYWVGTESKRIRVRISLGESVTEALSQVGEKNATNDHALRDGVYDVGFLSTVSTGESGFRFAFLQLLEEGSLQIKSVRAVAIQRDLPLRGSFRCSDPLLDEIWQVAVRTVHLNMQEYLWDGIKRDRLIWVGDMHTEVLSILAAFGEVSLVEKSLAVMERVVDKGNGYMNTMFTYSMWWVMIRYELYMATADLAPVERNRAYLCRMMQRFLEMPEATGSGISQEALFLDWPTYENKEVSSAGITGVLRLTLWQGAALLRAIGEESLAEACEGAAERMAECCHPDPKGSKAAGAFLTLAGLLPKEEAAALLTRDGAAGYSTFLGYYLLKAAAGAAGTDAALDAIRSYWGGMLKMGATSFWEDFDLEWMKNASPIDRLPKEGEGDIHGDNGRHCYVGFRHSLCHGWASGPCPFLMHHVLGIEILEPGMKTLRLTPHLGSLTFAEGSFPTPSGDVWVRYERGPDGKLHTEIRSPEGVRIEEALEEPAL